MHSINNSKVFFFQTFISMRLFFLLLFLCFFNYSFSFSSNITLFVISFSFILFLSYHLRLIGAISFWSFFRITTHHLNLNRRSYNKLITRVYFDVVVESWGLPVIRWKLLLISILLKLKDLTHLNCFLQTTHSNGFSPNHKTEACEKSNLKFN